MMQPFFATAADDAVPTPEPPVRSVPRGAEMLRLGLVCPYSLESPGGVQNHVLGLARHLRERGRHRRSGPGELPARLATTLDKDEFASAGTAVPLRYNGSVAEVGFGPLTAARASWLRWGLRPAARTRADHAQRRPARPLGRRCAGRGHLPHRDAAVPVDAAGRRRAAAGVGEAARPDRRQRSARLVVVSTWVAMRWSSRTASGLPTSPRHPEPARPADRRPRLLFLGRTDEPRKGLDVLLAALPAIRRAVPDLEVVVAGQGARPLPPGCVGSAWSTSCRRRTCGLGRRLRRPAPGPGELRHRGPGGHGWWRSRWSPPTCRRSPSSSAVSARCPAERGVLFAGGRPDGLAQAVVDTLHRPDPARGERAGHRPPVRLVRGQRSIESVYRAGRGVRRRPGGDPDGRADRRRSWPWMPATGQALSWLATGWIDEHPRRADLGGPRCGAGPPGPGRRRTGAGAASGSGDGPAGVRRGGRGARARPGSRADREQAESDLSHVLDLVTPA